MLARLLFIWVFLLSSAAFASGEVMYIHTDGLGSPVARSDKNGNYISGSRTRYEPYGATAAGATPTIGFTGHVNDPDTGLIYMQQRYYDPYAGRFLSTDPVLTDANTGGGFNRYVYAHNNPYKFIDPDGRNPLLIRATYAATYEAATWFGAGIVGTFIGAAIHDAINSPTITSGTTSGTTGTAVGADQGCVYCVPGSRTTSGNDYIGTTDDFDRRQKENTDGRIRLPGDVVDTYDLNNKDERRQKEQQWINDKGGLKETDNKRNEIAEKKWEKKGVKPPPPKDPKPPPKEPPKEPPKP